jgi:hypothetical protein
MSEDSRLESARIMLVQAQKTDDDTYAYGLLLEARKNITEVLMEF